MSAVGLYSVMAYAVTQRTHEIGLRMALGAQSRHARWLLLRGSAGVVGGGLVVGLPAALGVGQLLQSSLVHQRSRSRHARGDRQSAFGRGPRRVDRPDKTRNLPGPSYRLAARVGKLAAVSSESTCSGVDAGEMPAPGRTTPSARTEHKPPSTAAAGRACWSRPGTLRQWPTPRGRWPLRIRRRRRRSPDG
ncbi:MAG: FtsX-like permease family protein [Luteitalea sp.]|nr:FtsX-like permease family protein [Luteitalea sp.]